MKVFSPVTFNPRDVPAIHTQVVQTNSHPLKPWLKKKILAKCINFVFAWTNLPWGKPFHNNSIFPKRKCKVQRSKTKANLHTFFTKDARHIVLTMEYPCGPRSPEKASSLWDEISFFLSFRTVLTSRLTIFPPAVSSSSNYIPDDKQIATPNINLTLLYFRKYFVCIVLLNLHNRVC